VSGSGAPALAVDGTGLRVAVVAASWHEVVMDGLLDGARRGLRDAAVKDAFTVRVPGTFDCRSLRPDSPPIRTSMRSSPSAWLYVAAPPTSTTSARPPPPA